MSVVSQNFGVRGRQCLIWEPPEETRRCLYCGCTTAALGCVPLGLLSGTLPDLAVSITSAIVGQMQGIHWLLLPGFGWTYTTCYPKHFLSDWVSDWGDCLQEDNLEIRLDEGPGELSDSPEQSGGFRVHSRKMDGPLGGDGKFSPGDICKEVPPRHLQLLFSFTMHLSTSQGLLCAAPELCAMRCCAHHLSDHAAKLL